jgi:cell division protein FtsI (penicillin-binding protein 3)
MRVVIGGVLALVVVRLGWLQLTGAGATYRALGAEETTVSAVQPAARGAIYDRNGATLAMSVPVDQVIADPYLLHDPAAAAAELAPLIGRSVGGVTAQLEEPTGYVVVDRTLPAADAPAVERLDLPGVTLDPGYQQVFPAGSLLAPVIGGVDAAGVGSGGLEYQYQSLLAGRPGRRVEAVAPSGVAIAGTVRTVTAARPGSSLELTIDEPLQYEVDQLLSAGVASAKAVNGMAIVMDPRTGAILAMASVVRDAATGAVTPAPQNLAVDDVYEPGSVFKLVTFSAALQDGIITPDTVVDVPALLPIDGAIFHDAEPHPAEPLTATQILAQSSNMGTILIAERLGAQRLADQITHLGFGQPTGLHFPGASPGIVKPVSTWSPTAIGSTPIGQDTGVTPLQVLDVFNTVANGGVAETPRLVRAVIGPGGTVHRLAPPPGRRLVAAGADAELAHMMESVVTVQGTAPGAAVPGYTVAGKTGTSQIPAATGGYQPGAYWATFAGFVPEQDPALSAIVVLTQPDSEYGGAASAPIFSKIMQYALHRYDIPASPDGGVQPLPPHPGQVAGG